MMMYKLKKIKVEEGKSSRVLEGTVSEGNLYIFSSPDDVNSEAGVKDVEVGKQVLVYENLFWYIRTSPVSEIIDRTENSVTFKTGTSTYLLEEIDE